MMEKHLFLYDKWSSHRQRILIMHLIFIVIIFDQSLIMEIAWKMRSFCVAVLSSRICLRPLPNNSGIAVC